MKRIFPYFSLLVFTLLLSSCVKDKCTETVTYIKETPVYIQESDLHQEITNEAPRLMENPGKIYFYLDYILINEKYEGVHIIDNSEPSAPNPIAFINIKGNVDLAVKDGILYADSYLDLLAIDISTPTEAVLLSRNEKVIPPLWSNPTQGYMVYYTYEEVTEERVCGSSGGGWFGGGWDNDLMFSSTAEGSSNGSGDNGAGVGGSFARFTLANDHLYTISDADLNVFDLSTPSSPALVNTVNIGWGIETIFPYQDKLFIGSNTGLFIFDNSNPTAPALLSDFTHANGCDPVFVDGNYAYVTLRSGNACEGFTDQLDLIDITSLTNPSLIESFPMDNPHGLTKSGNQLFVCEGDFGLKAFDATVPEELDHNLTTHFKEFSTYDAISLSNGLLMVIGKDGLYQFDFSDPEELKQISLISVSR